MTYGELLQVVQDELATGGLDDPSPVGGGVVGGSLSEGDTLSHLREGQGSAGRRKAFFCSMVDERLTGSG